MNERQRTFFDQEHAADMEAKHIEPIDPNLAATEKPRLRGQNLAIYERLQRGPVTNTELAQIALKYTSRISDIRRAIGPEQTIVAVERDRASGVTIYRLFDWRE